MSAFHRQTSLDQLDPDLKKSVDHSFFDSDDEGNGGGGSPVRSSSRRCEDRTRSLSPPKTPATDRPAETKQTNDVRKSLRAGDAMYSENFESDESSSEESSSEDDDEEEEGSFHPMKYSEGSKGASDSDRVDLSTPPPPSTQDTVESDDDGLSLSQSGGSGSVTDVSPLDSPRFSPIPWREGDTLTPLSRPLPVAGGYYSRKPVDLLQLQDLENEDDEARDLSAGYRAGGHHHDDTTPSRYHYRCSHNRNLIDPSNDKMDVNRLLKEVLKLEDDQISRTSSRGSRAGSRKPFVVNAQIKQNPHKNLSFSNIRSRDVDHENKRLLKQILNPGRQHLIAPGATHGLKEKRTVPQKYHKPASAGINRYNSQRKIENENKAFLRRLEGVQPSTELDRDSLMKDHESQVKHHLNVSRAQRPPEGVLIKSPSRPGSGVSERAPSVSSVRSTASSSGRKYSSRALTASHRYRPRAKPRPAWDDRFSHS